MHRTNAPGNVSGLFVAENPAINQPPTEIVPEDLNAWQEELATFIEWAGLTLSPGDNSQLKQAILAKFVTLTGLQGGGNLVSHAGGTADAITASFTPAITALDDGMSLFVRAKLQNETITPTFTPAIGITPLVIVKGANQSLVPGDIAGSGHRLQLQYDADNNNWVLLNPAKGLSNYIPTGMLIEFAGNSAPAGFLACPTSATDVLIADYPELHAKIGTVWGGDGVTTFGLPFFPVGYASVHNPGAVGTQSVGQVISHSHTYTFKSTIGGSLAGGDPHSVSDSTTSTGLTGGSANLAAGSNVLICVKT